LPSQLTPPLDFNVFDLIGAQLIDHGVRNLEKTVKGKILQVAMAFVN